MTHLVKNSNNVHLKPDKNWIKPTKWAELIYQKNMIWHVTEKAVGCLMKPQPEHTFAAWISETSTKQNHSFPFKCIQPNKIIFLGIKWTTTNMTNRRRKAFVSNIFFFLKMGRGPSVLLLPLPENPYTCLQN